jgi:hypothetical protein
MNPEIIRRWSCNVCARIEDTGEKTTPVGWAVVEITELIEDRSRSRGNTIANRQVCPDCLMTAKHAIG